MTEYILYGLRIIGNKKFFYIGITKDDLKSRLSNHFGSVGSDSNKAKVSILNRYKGRIECVPLKNFNSDKPTALNIEYVNIERYRKVGHPLTNRKFEFDGSGKRSILISESVHKKITLFAAKNHICVSAFCEKVIMQNIKSKPSNKK